MKKYPALLIAAFLFGLAGRAHGQSWELGLRLGDPSGITLKRYNAGKALEFNFGRTQFWYKDEWYSKQFYNWYKARGYAYDQVNYYGYRSTLPLALQVHVLIQKPIDGARKAGLPGFYWYYGLGAQMRFNTYYFNYRYKQNGSNWIYVTDARAPNFDLGVDLVLGIEYRFKAPISLFLDGNLSMEVWNDPFLFWLQSGIGVRYRF